MTDEPYIYCGQPVSSYSLWDLGNILQSLLDAEAKREQAKTHPKFDKNSSKFIGELPPPNPEFLKLKSAIENEIKAKQNV